MNDRDFMALAVEEAKKAFAVGETPVGAVVAYGDRVVSAAFNTRETEKNALRHAEIKAIDEACKALGGWRLWMCDIYVTLEPCAMCAGAIVQSRIKRVVYGAPDTKSGAFGGKFDINAFGLNHVPEVVGGVMEDECSRLMSGFFLKLRQKG
ncbi:MAG: nucleoside deaminase [Clostridia bacterium]|nr:nucleoside deaminase [Clostridia bacterium]